MKKLKLFLLVLLVFTLNVGLFYWFRDILQGQYYELGTNIDSEAVYFDATGGINYAEREHKIAHVIPFGTEQYYAFIDTRNKERPVLYTAIVTDPKIIAKLDNDEPVRLQGIKVHLKHDAQPFYNKVLTQLQQDTLKLKIIASSDVIDTSFDKTKIIMYLLFAIGALVYCLWLFVKECKENNQTTNEN